MEPKTHATMTPVEQDYFAAMEERRQRGVPNGVMLVDAIALHMVSADEVERARWGDGGPLPVIGIGQFPV